MKNKTDTALMKVLTLMMTEILERGVDIFDLEKAIYKALGMEKEIEETPF